MDITEFPSGVIEHLGWYVYRLIDPRDGSTFYVGKGKGNRVFAHMRGEVAATDDDELLSNKLKQIREIRLPSSPGHWRVISALKCRASRSIPAPMRTDVQPFHSRPFTRSVTLSFIALAPSEGSPAQSRDA